MGIVKMWHATGFNSWPFVLPNLHEIHKYESKNNKNNNNLNLGGGWGLWCNGNDAIADDTTRPYNPSATRVGQRL